MSSNGPLASGRQWSSSYLPRKNHLCFAALVYHLLDSSDTSFSTTPKIYHEKRKEYNIKRAFKLIGYSKEKMWHAEMIFIHFRFERLDVCKNYRMLGRRGESV